MKEIEDLKKELRNELKEEMQKLRDEILVKYEEPKEVAELIPGKKEETSFNEEFAENILKSLANKERLKILRELYGSAKYFSELLESTKLDNPPLIAAASSCLPTRERNSLSANSIAV